MTQQTTSQPLSSSQMWERLETFVRDQIQRFIQALLEEEITELLGRPKSARRGAVDAPPGMRNGDGKPRRLTLTSGTITVRRPRVRGLGERFVSRVLPLFPRRTKQVGELLPQLYLHGLALGDFELALRGLLGEGAPLSAASLARLKARWQLEYDAWKHRRLDDLEVVYVWADGLSGKAGRQDIKAALLVLIGALTNGQKVVLAVESGQRASHASWGAVLRDLRARGLKPWRCTMAAGHLGIWAALAEQQPTAAEPRCWHHRITHVLDAIPKKEQAQELGAQQPPQSLKESLYRLVVAGIYFGLRRGELQHLVWGDTQGRQVYVQGKTLPDGRPWVPKDRSRAFHADSLTAAMEGLLKPLSPELSLHSLRHTFATWRLEMGDPLIRVRALMGHADANTLLRYAHVRVDPMADLLPLLP